MTRQTVGMRVFLGFALWGMAEIAAFVVVGAWIGVLGVFALVLGTGVLGVALLRRQGMQAVGQMRGGVVMLRPEGLGASGLTVLGGVLLVLPGLLTDVVGLLLVLPPVQRIALRWVAARFKATMPDDVIDGTAVEVEATRLPSGWTKP